MTIRTIQEVVAAYYKLRPEALVAKGRYAPIVHARQVAIYLAHELTGKSFAAIGRHFNRDHSTALHSCRVVFERMQTDDELYLTVRKLRARLESPEVGTRAGFIVSQERATDSGAGILTQEVMK